ncbi:MAG: argininosuccinate lyase [Candidatus Omnitrophica bacterium]|nr:argininosuccinate lyase [Candidatus Omnitrophota bacterium]
MAKKLWGGRFTKKTDPSVEEFSKSISYDYKLAKYDLLGSLSHVGILKKTGYLTSEEAKKLEEALDSIFFSINNKTFKFDRAVEDIHTDIQNKLQKKVGDLVLKLHTARSRNDQVVFATKLYCKVEIKELYAGIVETIAIISKAAKANEHIIIPGFTHMQHAQPVYLKDYLDAYAAMLGRDASRLNYISEHIVITMGAGALAGTPISAEDYALKASEYIKEQGIGSVFNIKPTTNSLDSVSDRDFVIEIISALSILAMHLSRLAEDLIIWSTKEFDFIEIDEAFCTGSSLMPQKKNADALELIRGHTGRLYGSLVSVLTMMKGLPLTYNRDMQLDKEPLFNSFEIVSMELKVLCGIIKTLKFNEENIKKHLEDESLYATDLVYYLVDLGVPFKNAHTFVGRLVKYSIDNNIAIKAMPEELLKKMLSSKISKKELIKRFSPEFSVESKKSIQRTGK